MTLREYVRDVASDPDRAEELENLIKTYGEEKINELLSKKKDKENGI